MYEFNPTLAMPFDQALEKIREALMSELSASSVSGTCEPSSRPRWNMPAYHILGACNPTLADRVISSEPNAGTLLPRNFILREDEAGNTVVSFMDPVPVPGLCATDEPKAVAAEAREMLQRVPRKLGG